MTQFVRNRVLAEVKSTGRTKHSLDILVWIPNIIAKDLKALRDVCILKEHLGSLVPYVCDIRFHIPETFITTISHLAQFGIPFFTVPPTDVTDAERTAFNGDVPAGLLEASATAISSDCDLMLTRESDWFPFWREFENYNLLAVDGEVLKRQCEIFVRGHDLPWSFVNLAWNYPWTTFYLMVEHQTFATGLRFHDACHKKTLGQDLLETGRMFIHNRLPNLCFTRDRLLFYELQRRAAKRARWTRQKFSFEVGYYLEFYYLMIFGGLDSMAVLLNYALNMGLKPRKVSAQSQAFLKALSNKAPEIYAEFVDPKFTEFLGRIASLRHLAAHRGSIMPGQVYEKRAVEPTPEELDEEIRKRGLGAYLEFLPAGPLRDWARQSLRDQMYLETSKKLLDDVLLVKVEGGYGFIHPMYDIEWNFDKFHAFVAKVLEACLLRI